MQHWTLNTGNSIPTIGVGTHRIDETGRTMEEVVAQALECGYRMFDTAAGYGNEQRLGSALAQSGIGRKDIYIVTKLDDVEHSRHTAPDAIERALEQLQTDYIDLFLIHAPNSQRMREWAVAHGYQTSDYWAKLNRDAWAVMEEYHRRGVLKNIGVSNFHIRHLECLSAYSTVVPAVNQIKMCPGSLQAQQRLLRYCAEQRICVMGYSPLGRGNALELPEVKRLARLYGKTPAQILLRSLNQQGIISIPRAASGVHMRQNLDIYDFTLDPKDICLLNELIIDENWSLIKDPDTAKKYNREE